MRNRKKVWLPDHVIDRMIDTPGCDELICRDRVRVYLGLDDVWALSHHQRLDRFPFLKIVAIGGQRAIRISDLRRFLQWRQIVWNAWDAELLVSPVEVKHYYEEAPRFPDKPPKGYVC